ncbi:MAG TPA: ABC transporter permease [Bacilli bacterium]|nr:ABC transporter permease [Bacilli bacterium]
MTRYILKRIGLIFFTAFIILSLTFILMKSLPSDLPAGTVDARIAFYENQVRLGYYFRVDSAQIHLAEVIIIRGTERYMYAEYPVMAQYLRWIGNIVREWDWGTSTRISLNESAIEIIAKRIPYTIRLNLIALFIAVPLGFVFGIWAALKKNKATDHIISTFVMLFISIPSFVVISYLMAFFAYGLGWLPSQWPADNNPTNVKVLGYIIPVAALCFGTIAGFARYTRAELTEVMSSEFLLLARTKGLTRRQTVIRHAMRNSMVPIVPMIIGQFIGILSGSVVLESLYGIPGIGNLFVTALTQKDYNVIMVDMAIFTLIGLFAALLVDLSYGIVDPRIRMGARK